MPGWSRARAGADTQVTVHVPISQLRQMPGADDLADAWLRGKLGEAGEPGTARLAGEDAEVAACDALTVPVVTGHGDMTMIDKIIALTAAAPDPASASASAAASDVHHIRHKSDGGETSLHSYADVGITRIMPTCWFGSLTNSGQPSESPTQGIAKGSLAARVQQHPGWPPPDSAAVLAAAASGTQQPESADFSRTSESALTT